MRRALALLALAGLLAGAGVTASGADFTHAAASPGNSFAASTNFNTVAVTVTNPGAALHGTVTLQSTATSERGIASVRYQSAPAGTTTWTDACVASTAPFSCDWNTAGVADGVRDLRAIAVDQAGYQQTSATVASRRVDNIAPTVTLNDPGPYLTGTKTLTAGGADGNGLASLAIEYRPAGGAWTTLCSGATSPRSCALNTASLPDGSYELRARAADAAGNVSDAVLTRVVDNTAPTGSIPAPGPLAGTVTVPITAADGAGSGVASVTGQFRPQGTTSWTPVCVVTTTPYECAGLDTRAYPDGLYEARAIIADRAGFSTTTATITVRLDNTAPSGADVQTTNSGTAGQIGTNDTIRLTYSEAIAPASILSGWTGSAQAIRVYVNDGGTSDTLDFRNSTGATRLNLVNSATDLNLGRDFVADATIFNATMTMSGSTVTVRIDSRIFGTLKTVTGTGTLTWRPSAAALDLAGLAASTALVTETGTADRDF